LTTLGLVPNNGVVGMPPFQAIVGGT